MSTTTEPQPRIQLILVNKDKKSGAYGSKLSIDVCYESFAASGRKLYNYISIDDYIVKMLPDSIASSIDGLETARIFGMQLRTELYQSIMGDNEMVCALKDATEIYKELNVDGSADNFKIKHKEYKQGFADFHTEYTMVLGEYTFLVSIRFNPALLGRTKKPYRCGTMTFRIERKNCLIVHNTPMIKWMFHGKLPEYNTKK